MATKNNNQTENNNQANNSLQYATYTSAKSGKTIPVLVGFTGKDDPRIAYIAQIGKDGEPSAVHGRYTQLPFGIDETRGTYVQLESNAERIPCVMWGAAECWHKVAKLAAKTVSDLDTLTQESYDALCDLADKAYQQRKEESEKAREERKSEPKAETPAPRSGKPAAKKGAQKSAPTPKPKAEKPAPKTFTEVYPLSYMACTDEKGQNIPAIVGFKPDGYDPRWDLYGDPRITHICGEEGKASPVNATESRIELDGKEQICVTFPVGYDDIAKRVVKLLSDDKATTEQWEAVCKDAAALSKPAPAPKPKAEKPAPRKEVTITATKKARTYTEDALMKAFAKVAKTNRISGDNKDTLETFLKAIIKAAA